MANPVYQSGLSAAFDVVEPEEQDFGQLELLDLAPLDEADAPRAPEPAPQLESSYICTAICSEHGPYSGSHCELCR